MHTYYVSTCQIWGWAHVQAREVLYHFNQFNQSHITGPNFGRNSPPGHRSRGPRSDGPSERLPHLGVARCRAPQVGRDIGPCHGHWALRSNLPTKTHVSRVTPPVELIEMVQYMILPESRLSESASTPAPGLSSQPKSGGGKEPGLREDCARYQRRGHVKVTPPLKSHAYRHPPV